MSRREEFEIYAAKCRAGENAARPDGRDAKLRGADLRGADLRGADLRGADLRGANLGGARLGGAKLGGAKLPDAPRVQNLDALVAEAVRASGDKLDMDHWHTECGTSHCRAGWAIVLAGEDGKELEGRIGPAAAGSLIYARSTGEVPDFYTDNETALADIRTRAGGVTHGQA